MNTLIMNAAEGRIQIALAQEETLLCAQEWSAPSKGTELLTPVLADMLGRLGLRPASVDRIACVAGPGSFTGLRLVLTTASRRSTCCKPSPRPCPSPRSSRIAPLCASAPSPTPAGGWCMGRTSSSRREASLSRRANQPCGS